MAKGKIVDALYKQLEELGFSERLNKLLRTQLTRDSLAFTLEQGAKVGADRIGYKLFYQKDPKHWGEYRLQYFDVELTKEKPIPHVTLNNVDTWELDKRMGNINWLAEVFDDLDNLPPHLKSQMDDILTDFWRLGDRSSEGKFVQGLLHGKHWAGTVMKYPIRFGDRPKSDGIQRFDIWDGQNVTAKEAYNLIDFRSVKKEADPHWYRLPERKNYIDPQLKPERIPGSDTFDLDKAVTSTIPKPLQHLLTDEMRYDISVSLRAGDAVAMVIADGNREGKVMLSANPSKRNIALDYVDDRFPAEARLVKFELLNEKMEPFSHRVNPFEQIKGLSEDRTADSAKLFIDSPKNTGGPGGADPDGEDPKTRGKRK